MNETFNLTLTTNVEALIAAGALVWTVMFGCLIMSTQSAGRRALSGMRSLSRDIQMKDFSFKPEFDKRNGALKIGPYRYSEEFPPIAWI